jgi:hypothetical protein
MSEQELRDGLKLAVADEPPMKFDLDDLMDTAERLARRRRALIAVGASTAAVAVAAVAVPVVLGISGGGAPLPIPQAAPPSSSVVSPAPTTNTATSTTPPKRPALTEAQLRERGKQMQAHLRNAFPAAVPAAKQVTYGVFGGESEGAVSDGQSYLNAFVRFTTGAKTAVDVYVSDNQQYAERTCAGCQPRPQQDGSLIVLRTENGRTGNDSAMRITSAVHLRNDGSTVRITTYNYDPTGGDTPQFQADVALSMDQLIRLATDPALHL